LIKVLRVVLPILVLAGAGLAMWLLIESRVVPETRPPAAVVPTVETMTASLSRVTLRVRAEGTVAPRTETQLVPEVAGRVIEVSDAMVAGGFFEEGEVLFRLDPREYELAVTQARAAIAQANLRLETEYQEAALAEREWELLDAGQPTPLALRVPQIAEAEAALASAQAALQQAEYDLERTSLRAPYAGRVRSESIDLGQFVQPGSPVATVYSVDAAEVRLPIPDAELAFMNLPLGYRDDGTGPRNDGPRVILRAQFAGREHEWTGRIVRTEGEIDRATRMIHAIAQVDDPYARGNDPSRPPLAVGMFVTAEIIGRGSGEVVDLPRSVLRGADEVLLVEHVDGKDLLRLQQVDVFRLERDRVLIRSGIEEGARVVVSPLENAVTGMQVRVAPASDSEDERRW
jgi:multidrug efflux system membrane fusion protein